jgi:hypothetical protein
LGRLLRRSVVLRGPDAKTWLYHRLGDRVDIFTCTARLLSFPKRTMFRAAHIGRTRFCRLFFGAGIASLVSIGQVSTAHADEQAAETARLNAAIAEKTAKLGLKPRTVEPTSEKARRVRSAIEHSEFSAAHQIIAEVLAKSQLQHWRYYPFEDLIASIADLHDSKFEAHLNEWVEQSKADPLPTMVRAQFYYDAGWFERGHAFAKETGADQFSAFTTYMAKALVDVDAAIQSDDAQPYNFVLKLRILRGIWPKERAVERLSGGDSEASQLLPAL